MKRIEGKVWQRYLFVLSLAAAVCLGGLGLSSAFGAGSNTLNVTTTADTSASGGACGNSSIKAPPSPLSLREATCLANNLGGEVTINLPAGTYTLANGELKFAEASGVTVNIAGAGAASTIIDGQALSRVLNIDFPSVGGVHSKISGVTITRGAPSSVGGGCILAGSGTSATGIDLLTLEGVVVSKCQSDKAVPSETNQPGGGLLFQGGTLVVKNSTFRESGSNSSPGAAIAYYNYSNTPGPQTFTMSNATIVGNRTVNSNSSTTNVGGAVYISATQGEEEIAESQFRENESKATTQGGAVGAAIFVETGAVKVTGSTFSGNSVSNSGTGIAKGAAFYLTNSGSSTTLQYNRIVGNTPVGTAVGGNGTINATENWWGCNSGPGNSGCDGTATGAGSVTSSPWLQFRASASPTTVAGPNGTSTLNANFATDSAGTTISVANLAAFNGAAVTWSDPQPSPATINGTTGSSTTNLSGGQATATYNSVSASGSGHAVAAFDNASSTIPLTIDQKPAVTGNPSNQTVPAGTTATFTASATGTPTPSVQWERNTGSGFAPISGATSTTYSFTTAQGETGYQFRARFTNTIEGTPYSATTTAATLTVGKAQTTLSTNASSATIGGPIHDTATLSGGSSPTGTITFKAYAPGDTTCSAPTPAFTSSPISVTKNGIYESGEFTPVTAGEYRWTASYSGDATNEAATGACNAANEKSAVSQATTTLSTNATSATIGGAIHDTATIAGGYSPGGTITFEAFAPGDTTCASPIQAAKSTVSVTKNGSYESAAFTPGTAGEYRWTATYSGDGNNKAATGACNAANEVSAITKITPTLATIASSSVVGNPIHDTATISGGYSPGGTITFRAYAPGDTTCSAPTPAFTSSPISVTANGSYESGAFTPGAAGEYRWTAVYSGDPDNEAVTDPCNASNETSTVAKATPALSTTATSATLGGSIHDTAVLSGGVGPGGTITFRAFAPGDTNCSAPIQAATSIVNVTANGSYESGAYTPEAAGEYRWTAVYSGDANNKEATPSCGDPSEISKVGLASPTISTEATSATIGGTIHDTATIAGGGNPSGTLTFEAFGPDDATCGGQVAFTKPVTVKGNGEYGSTDFEAKAAGTYRWVVSYSGDANNEGATSACNAVNEKSSVAKASPTISTEATDTTIGGKIHDTATIAGGYMPSGSITFKAFGPGDTSCNTSVFSESVPVTANGSYDSPDYEPSHAGDYRWTASYSGDANNDPVSSGCNAVDETSSVAKATPTISTTATDASLGKAVHDTATIAGGHGAGGTVTFRAFAPTDTACSGTAAFDEPVQVSGDGEYSSPDFTPSTIGDYRWTASYSGDADNEAVASACNAPNETSTITPAVTSLATSATDAVIGSPIHDAATLSGGQNPTGTITFEVYGPDDATCAGPVAETLTASVSGNGTYGSGDFTPVQSGEYRWVASYSGDAENDGSTGTCADPAELSTVAKGALTVSSTATDAVLGAAIHDMATLAAGHNPGGTISFEAFGPDDTTCAGPAAFTKTLPVTGAGSYGSGDFVPTAAGTYRWVVSYSGDVDNLATAAACGAAGETSTVAAPPATNPSGGGSTGAGAGTGGKAPAPPIDPCVPAPATTAGGYVPRTKVQTGIVPGVRARIHVAVPSNLQIAATLKYRLEGQVHSVDLGSSLLEDPGTRNLRLALPSALRGALPLGTKVRLALAISAVPAGGSCADPKQSHLTFKTKIVKVLLPR